MVANPVQLLWLSYGSTQITFCNKVVYTEGLVRWRPLPTHWAAAQNKVLWLNFLWLNFSAVLKYSNPLVNKACVCAWGGGGEGSVAQVGVCVCAWVRKVCARVCMPVCESIHFFTPFFFFFFFFFPFCGTLFRYYYQRSTKNFQLGWGGLLFDWSCFTSAQSIRTIKDREPRTTPPLSHTSWPLVLCVTPCLYLPLVDVSWCILCSNK